MKSFKEEFKFLLEGVLAVILGFFSFGFLSPIVMSLIEREQSISDWFFLTLEPLMLIAGILFIIQPLYFLWRVKNRLLKK